MRQGSEVPCTGQGACGAGLPGDRGRGSEPALGSRHLTHPSPHHVLAARVRHGDFTKLGNVVVADRHRRGPYRWGDASPTKHRVPHRHPCRGPALRDPTSALDGPAPTFWRHTGPESGWPAAVAARRAAARRLVAGSVTEGQPVIYAVDRAVATGRAVEVRPAQPDDPTGAGRGPGSLSARAGSGRRPGPGLEPTVPMVGDVAVAHASLPPRALEPLERCRQRQRCPCSGEAGVHVLDSPGHDHVYRVHEHDAGLEVGDVEGVICACRAARRWADMRCREL